MIYFESKQTAPGYNLALETWLLETYRQEDVLYLWQNGPSVIIGSNQVAANEVDLELAQRLRVPVVRRHTGGGAVYHDLGNLNFTWITRDTPASDRPYETFLAPLIRILRGLGIEAEFNGRNDLCVQGRKISGSAARVRQDRLLHHGTLLVDCDLQTMERLLTPPAEKLARNGVRSVKSRVATLREFAPELTVQKLKTAICQEFQAGAAAPVPEVAEEAIARLRREKFDNPAWNLYR